MRKSFLILSILMLLSFMANAQLIKDRTNGLITIGFDLYTDINTGNKYENFDLRAINQGFGTYITYNLPMGESKHTVSLGAGFSCHNYYMKNAWLSEPYNSTITFKPDEAVKRSKINVNYFDIPIELNFRIADKFKISFGAKGSFLLSSKSKVIGDVYDDGWSCWWPRRCCSSAIWHTASARRGWGVPSPISVSGTNAWLRGVATTWCSARRTRSSRASGCLPSTLTVTDDGW